MSRAPSKLAQAFESRTLLTDGAMGPMIGGCVLAAADCGGPGLEGCNEHVTFRHHEVLVVMHEGHIDAGADPISPNPFGCAPYARAGYGLAARRHWRRMSKVRPALRTIPVEHERG